LQSENKLKLREKGIFMSQQLGIILLIDVAAAIEANTLEGNTYLFDNMKLQGSEGLGTGKLISAINGTSYCDGSQVSQDIGHLGQKIMDVTGNLVTEVDGKIPEINSLNPIITNITGEAVDKNVIYPAAYGSPDMVTDGWYWAASVDTSRPGT